MQGLSFSARVADAFAPGIFSMSLQALFNPVEQALPVPNAPPCGWLKDRYGAAWHIVPRIMGELMTAMLRMKKIDLAALKQAFAD